MLLKNLENLMRNLMNSIKGNIKDLKRNIKRHKKATQSILSSGTVGFNIEDQVLITSSGGT